MRRSSEMTPRVDAIILGTGQSECLATRSRMGVGFAPPRLIGVGGSYVGLESGQLFRRFGSGVTIVGMGPRLVRREDEDVSRTVQQILEREGIHVRLNAECI